MFFVWLTTALSCSSIECDSVRFLVRAFRSDWGFGDVPRDDFTEDIVDVASESESWPSGLFSFFKFLCLFGNRIADIDGGRPGVDWSCCFNKI